MASETQQTRKPEERKPATPGDIGTATIEVSQILARFDQGEQRRVIAGAAQIVGLPSGQQNNNRQQAGKRG